MVGQSIACPHCQLETLLFIPPAVTPPKQHPRTGKSASRVWLVVVVAILFACFMGALFLRGSRKQAKPSTPANLRPAVEAFGWKLGDRLPERLKSEVHDGHYSFRLEKETPPFNECELRMTDDGRIYSIGGTGYPPDYGQDSDTCKNALISLLSEKYGLRLHRPDALDGKSDVYEFGTEDQSVRLEVFERNLLTLEYCDKGLRSVSYDEQEAKRKKDEDDTKAALKKGL
jgi:hypothetical protein